MRLKALTCAVFATLSATIACASHAGERASPDPPAARIEPITPIPRPPPADGRSTLGEALFSDVRLSHGDARSCMSCHDLATNGAGGTRVDLAPDGRPLARNTPTVFNAALAFRQDWTGNARTLEQQAELSLLDPDLMATRWDELLPKLRADRAMSARFAKVYEHELRRDDILDALAAFERRLLTPDGPFDRWLRGDDSALTPEQSEGYRLFKQIGCASCHQGVAVGANLFERTNVFQSLFVGRGEHMRVASLRNVAVTAPYFDDGSAGTLGEAVDRMARAQLGSPLEPEKRDEIVAFLGSLTGRYEGRPLSMPLLPRRSARRDE